MRQVGLVVNFPLPYPTPSTLTVTVTNLPKSSIGSESSLGTMGSWSVNALDNSPQVLSLFPLCRITA